MRFHSFSQRVTVVVRHFSVSYSVNWLTSVDQNATIAASVGSETRKLALHMILVRRPRCDPRRIGLEQFAFHNE
jgi:hypothetical protein